jgi:hypothetical protein
VTVATGDEVEICRPVRAESAFVRLPIEAAGGFGVARGFEFGDALGGGGVSIGEALMSSGRCSQVRKDGESHSL